MNYRKLFKIIIVFVGLFALSSCNKEKAEAVQIAAEQFRVDAISALDQINYIYNQDVSIAKLSEEEQIEELIEILNIAEISDLKNETFDDWAKNANPGRDAEATTNAEFEKLKAQYYQFEEMFKGFIK